MPSDERWKRDLRLDLKKKKKKRNREKEKRGKDTRDATPDTQHNGDLGLASRMAPPQRAGDNRLTS